MAEKIIDNVEQVIIGKHQRVQLALICRGHILINDVPGVRKTMLAKSIARSLGCTFKRIQFTPDMLSSDVTGISVFDQKTREFQFRPGPLRAQIVLTDEINRATPKTQSALLEAMEERQVSKVLEALAVIRAQGQVPLAEVIVAQGAVWDEKPWPSSSPLPLRKVGSPPCGNFVGEE